MTQKANNFSLYLLMFNIFITMAGIGLIIPIMPEYLANFNVAGQVLGFLIAVFSFSQFIFSPLTGELSDKHGRKNLILIGLVIYGVSQLAFGLSTQLWMLYIARFVSGIGAAFIIPPTMAFVADITTKEERGKGMGLIGAAMSFGIMIGPALGGFMANISIVFPFFFGGVVAILAAVLSYFALPNPVPKVNVNASPTKPEGIIQQMRRSVKTPYFVMFIVMFVFSFGLANLQSTLALYMDKEFLSSPLEIAVIITVGGFVGVIAQTFFVNALFKRFGEMKVILINLLIAAFSMLGVLFVHTYLAVLLVSTIFFIATSLLRPAVNTLVSKLAGNEQGFAAGMITAYMSLGNMIGPALAGVLFDIDVAYPYIFGTILLIVCFFIALTWSSRQRELLAPFIK